MGAQIAIRLDTEDFLTPQSDDALARILDILDRHEATATFPLVAEKLRSWEARHRSDLIDRLRRHAVGYHSRSHSVHPTIAEELAPLPWDRGMQAFASREAEGFDRVRAVFGPPACWTQPGGNWTAAALPVMRSWGVPMEFSESWNSYLDVGDHPCRYAGLLHWSPPVRAPKPFFSRLPGCLPEALAMVGSALEERRAGDAPLCVVAHPTELCTTAFWDAVNFSHGRMPPRTQWHPAPLRSAADIADATDALDAFFAGLRAMGLRFVTARDLVDRYPDRAPGSPLINGDIQGLARCVRNQACWAVSGDRALSAAEILGVLCQALAASADTIAVRACDGPPEPPPTAPLSGTVPRDAVLLAAIWCDRYIDAHGAVPPAVPLGRGQAAPADFLAALAQALLCPRDAEVPVVPRAVAAEKYVKPPSRLHWDWVVFPEDFAPMGLRVQACLQAWTLKPALASGPGGGRGHAPAAWSPGVLP